MTSGNASARAPGGDPIKKINGVCHSLFHHPSYHRITSSHHHRSIEDTSFPHISRAPTSGRAINNRQSASPLFTPYLLLPNSCADHRSAIHHSPHFSLSILRRAAHFLLPSLQDPSTNTSIRYTQPQTRSFRVHTSTPPLV